MRENQKNMIGKLEYVSEYVFGNKGYILSTLQKFRPQNFNMGKMNIKKIGTRIIPIKIQIAKGNTYN